MMGLHRGDLWKPEVPVKKALTWANSCVEALASGYPLTMQIHVPLPNGPESAGLARDAIRNTLKEWHHDESLDDLLVVGSELVTNAFRYGRGPFILHLTLEDDHLVIGVQDGEPAKLPIPKKAEEEQPNGRGLRIISAMTTHWGWKRDDGNKVVWAQLPLAS